MVPVLSLVLHACGYSRLSHEIFVLLELIGLYRKLFDSSAITFQRYVAYGLVFLPEFRV